MSLLNSKVNESSGLLPDISIFYLISKAVIALQCISILLKAYDAISELLQVTFCSCFFVCGLFVIVLCLRVFGMFCVLCGWAFVLFVLFCCVFVSCLLNSHVAPLGLNRNFTRSTNIASSSNACSSLFTAFHRHKKEPI